MVSTICNVIYVDRTVRQEGLIRASENRPRAALESPGLDENVNLLLDVFGHGMFPPRTSSSFNFDGAVSDFPL